MKAIQISMDESLLAQLDADEEVQRDGRSAVFRRAVSAYLRNRRANEIRERYQAAYGNRPGLSDEFDGWETQGSWPDP